MPIAEDEALAELLYHLYYQALGAVVWQWSELMPEERTAWIVCTQYILATFDRKQEPDHR